MNKILYVDDDSNILEAVKRQFRKTFDITTASDGSAGLELIQREGPFAIVLSDLRMPGMDGVQFLAKVRELDRDVVRIMLTGNADLDAAIHAVNEGSIFRFLTKPCPADTLEKAVRAGIEQYRLITSERELLEKTLNGGIKVLTDILALANPVAFGRAFRVKDYASQVAETLHVEDRWQLELAAMLSQIGCITIPPDTLEKKYHEEELSPEELSMIQAHPAVGGRLINNIPRLERVAEMISCQDFRCDGSDIPKDSKSRKTAPLEARILKAVQDFDTLLSSGATKGEAILALRKRTGWYAPEVLEALHSVTVIENTTVRQSVATRELLPHMIVAEDLRSRSGLLLASKGQAVTASLKERLKNFVLREEIEDKVVVLIRSSAANRAPNTEPSKVGSAGGNS